ncbi:thiamine pyrophosphate-dependent enzyme [Cuniculiplasma sp. SKW4]|uniref:thiamine pyrophosphate-dependent enzyme n=1 Tax=Cuniculiplasma sp. SKW4 TaxID=3400171 RepID=UPI003FD532C7
MSFLKNFLSDSDQLMLLLGNEAIARGAIEAGVGFAATYPGTPSSEVGEILMKAAPSTGMYFQYSINEKVAYEMAYGASLSGKRSFVFMKHVGLNVASDPFVTSLYTGIGAGMVVMTADDPSMFSSQNEQDNRRYGDLAHAPIIEPSDPQEAKDFIKIAFQLSEKYSIPVMLRTTTRVSHMRAPVHLGRIGKIVKNELNIKAERSRYTSVPSNARKLKPQLTHKMDLISHDNNFDSLNRSERSEGSTFGIITSGASYNYVKDALSHAGIEANILKLGMTNPIPIEITEKFMRENARILVVEELDPYLETKIRAFNDNLGGISKITGKLDQILPWSLEFSEGIVMKSIFKMAGIQSTVNDAESKGTPPEFCPGCPHRSSFFSIKRALRMAGKSDIILSSDIGCYSLSYYDPYEMADIILDMGASISVGAGISIASGKKTVAFIGDSTFFHSGIPAIINARRSNADMLIFILDNSTTAMTGQEPTPEFPFSIGEEKFNGTTIESILSGIGIEYSTVDAFDEGMIIKETINSVRQPGLKVIIVRGPCALLPHRKKSYYEVSPEECSGCMNCVDNFHCPAITKDGNVAKIDPYECDGCGACSEVYVCPVKAIHEVKL